MPKFELTDNAVLGLTAAGGSYYAAHTILAPKNFHSISYKEGTPLHEEPLRWCGAGLAAVAVTNAVLIGGDNLTPAGKKNLLKAQGGVYLATSVLSASNGIRDKQRKVVAYGTAGALVAVGALNLYQGFKK